jgi:hypothetical protein
VVEDKLVGPTGILRIDPSVHNTDVSSIVLDYYTIRRWIDQMRFRKRRCIFNLTLADF